MFQFHEGPIKTPRPLSSRAWICCFNSMKVRLKLGKLRIISMSILSFNSMKVRLKHFALINAAWEAWFQFHEGPIKTHCIFQ